MMSKKVPELRFAGFSDDWEERKLSDGTNKIGDGLHGTPKYSEDGEVYFVNGNNLVNGQIVITPETKRVTSNEQSKDDKALNDSTILMSINGTIGNLAWYRGENLMLGKSVAYIEVSDFDKKFIYAYLQTRPVKDYYLNSLTGTTIKNLGLKAIRNTNICTPTIDEQAKIGSFFKKLDDTIALYERKLDLLKEQKKGFLQKMFPKNGAKVPELRFAGFADDWEERKLKDVTERVKSNDGRMDLPTLTMSASSGWLEQKDRFSGDISGKEKKNYTLLKKGELSYNHGNSKLAKYGVVFSLTNYEEALVPRVYHSFRALENTSADFIEYMFATKLPDRELGKLVSSGARMDGLLNIKYDDFMNIHISIPNYEEQILISSFFRKLDEIIALHQRKLDLLKEQKKGFLQKMFV
ncbi:restriction endonuclease subunit S [Streptococcus thermophilus]|nr:restriction endonuclease subunit S [Streptococcus thermophilus]MCE2109451.1 restriction endonuclease subunit S [Streptococcus thermophilus]MCE2112842.1 restriction endonuclease subunit S [Streptococcus thermophilus]MCE2117247.1 restriction endonuclease subunit S [Streptococcus thermophilus]